MRKILQGLFDKKGLSRKELRGLVKKKEKNKTICYVLLTCSEPNAEGNMEVEMFYEGEKSLASYLIKSADGMIDGL